MQKLFENFRTFLNEAGDPDSNDDNLPNPEEVAKALERSTIENAIQDASFNSAQSSQHRWSPRQPIVDYNFDDRLGVWAYTASIPDGTNDAAAVDVGLDDGTASSLASGSRAGCSGGGGSRGGPIFEVFGGGVGGNFAGAEVGDQGEGSEDDCSSTTSRGLPLRF